MVESLTEAVKERVILALFGDALDVWTNFWRNWAYSAQEAGAVVVMGVAARYVLLTFDAKRVAWIMKYAFGIWALATLARGCTR